MPEAFLKDSDGASYYVRKGMEHESEEKQMEMDSADSHDCHDRRPFFCGRLRRRRDARRCGAGRRGYPAHQREQVAAVILHTNDAHVAFEDNIGYDGLALYKKELEEKYDHVLLIDAGDAIQGAPIGSVSKGAEIIRMMNRLGYDLAVPGNHEFDYGLEALDDCAEALDCGYTCANFCVTGGEPVFQPWRILEAGDLKIGFVGAVTPDAYTKSTIKDILNEAGEPMYDFLADETGQRLCVGLQKAIDETRQAGADYVILVSHLGNNESITEQFRTDAVVGKLRGLDLIIDGHSHETYNRRPFP